MILVATQGKAEYRNLARSVAGMLLLGTPHRGTNNNVDHSLLLYLVWSLQTGKQRVEPNILASMRQTSDILEDIVQSFLELLTQRRNNREDIHGRCFYEQQPSQMAYIVPGSNKRVTKPLGSRH